VLEADTFEYFKETGIFNKETAKKFRDNILSKGGSEHPMEIYKAFRGEEPSTKPLLRKSGLLKK
jgi:peptidyl-dipeptidase Dcp